MSDQRDVPWRHHTFLESEYKLKVDLAARQYDRILARFNYFLAIQSGLFGLAGFLWLENLRPVIFALAIVGLLSALLWLLTSIADRRLVTAYRDDARIAYYHVLNSFRKAPDQQPGSRCPEGQAPTFVQNALCFYEAILGSCTTRMRESSERISRRKDRSSDTEKPSFRTGKIVEKRILLAAGDVGDRGSLLLDKFSVTRMPTWASLGMTVIWLVVLYALYRPQDFGLPAWSSGLREQAGLPYS